MTFGKLVLAAVVFAPAFAFAGKATTFTYGYSGEKAATFEAYEASQIDLSKLRKVSEKFELKRNDGSVMEKINLSFTMKNGCDVLTTTSLEVLDLLPGEEAPQPYSIESKLCAGETFYTAEGKLIYVGKTDAAIPETYDGDGVFGYSALAMLKGARSGKIYYVNMKEAAALIRNSREFRAGRTISAGGHYEAKFIHDFVIGKIGMTKAHFSAKDALERTCTQIFGGQLTTEIVYKDGSYNAGDMTAHASASAVCSAN